MTWIQGRVKPLPRPESGSSARRTREIAVTNAVVEGTDPRTRDRFRRRVRPVPGAAAQDSSGSYGTPTLCGARARPMKPASASIVTR